MVDDKEIWFYGACGKDGQSEITDQIVPSKALVINSFL